ncbi:MAG: hypothetical protein QHH15_06670, partial [Candidatus Thermoplasmatota archaeon]|nr:hypothetical protein [Candidatus Thermoplasmatota archaeon]
CDWYLFHQFPGKYVDKFDTTFTGNLSEKECEAPQKTSAEFVTYYCFYLENRFKFTFLSNISSEIVGGLFG